MAADDLVLEYDMLHLDEDSMDAPDAVDELLNCAVNVSISSDAPVSCAASAGAACCSSTTAQSPVPSDDLNQFLLDGEQFLKDMEKVVKLDLDGDKTTLLEESDGAIDLDAFTDLELLSPCPSAPSSCPSTTDGSPCRQDDEFDVEFPLLKEEDQFHESLKGHVLPPMSPPRLLHTHSPSSASESSSMGHTDVASPLQEENVIQEDETMEEEAMEDEMELLEKEARYLDAQKDFLESRAKSSRPQRQSIKTKHRATSKSLQKSQEDNKLLNELFSQQKVYADNFKAMLAFAPVNDVRMALMTPMESYIRLGKDFDERRKTILAMREEKLDMTYKFIEQKAQGLDVNQPYQYSDMFEKFGKHYCVNFAISKYEGVSVFQVGRAIYEQIAGKDEALNRAMGSTTIRESFDTIKCNFMHQRIVSSMHWDGDESEKMPDMESNAIFFCRFGDNSAVLATDYIDQDDLHPYDTSNRIRKDVSSGVVLSGHEDANGNKFVVMKRYLMAKYHMYPHKVTQEQQDRFFASMPKCHDTMKTLIVDRLQQNNTCCPCPGED